MKDIKYKHYFYLNKAEEKRFKKIQKKEKNKFGKYGSYTFKFTPTGIGNGISIYSHLTHKEKDITDYDSW